MLLYPDAMYDRIEDIDIDKLKKLNIKGMILDIDNTLMDKTKILQKPVIDWVEKVKNSGIKVYILTNTNKRKKVEKVVNELKLPYIMIALKPLKRGFKKCLKLLQLEPKEICVIGDQIFTDVLGGNRMGMYTIYTKPINEKDCNIGTALKRPIEKKVIEKYLKERGKHDK